MPAEVLVLTCPLLQEEVEAVGRALGLRVRLGGLACACLPPGPRATPGAPPAPSAGALAAAEAPPPPLVVLASLCAGLARGGPPTCFHLLASATLVDDLLSGGSHLVTPGWLRHWRRHLADMGLDQETARALYGEASHEVVLLDTGVAADGAAELGAFSAHVGLAHRTLPVGLDQLRLRLAAQVDEARRPPGVA